MAKVKNATAVAVDNSEPALHRLTAPSHAATDKRGRVILVRKLNALDKARLFRAVGADNSRNEAFLSYALAASAVVTIDGQALPAPSTMVAIEARIQMLDDDGVSAVMEAFQELHADDIKEAKEFAEAAKNSPGMPT